MDSSDDSSDNKVLINLRSAKNRSKLRRSTRTSKPILKGLKGPLVDINNTPNCNLYGSKKKKKKKRNYTKQTIDQDENDSDYDIPSNGNSSSQEDNSEEEPLKHLKKRISNDSAKLHNGKNGKNDSLKKGKDEDDSESPEEVSCANYPPSITIDQINPYVILDLDLDIELTSPANKENTSWNTNRKDKCTVKKIFNLRSSATKKKKVNSNISEGRSTKAKPRIRQNISKRYTDANEGNGLKSSDGSGTKDNSKSKVEESDDSEKETLYSIKKEQMSRNKGVEMDISTKVPHKVQTYDSGYVPDTRAKDVKSTIGCGTENCEDVEEESEEIMIPARVLMSSGLDDGQSIYGFVTPKRKDALARIAQDVIESTRKSSKKSTKKSELKSSPKKTKGSTCGEDSAKESVSTTHRKMKNRVTLACTLAANESEDGEDSEDDESVSDESDDSNEEPKKKEERDILDEYFEVHGKSKSITSDKTLAKLKQPKMDQQELLEHLKDIQTSHVEETLQLHSIYHQQFEKWMFQLLSGFNVLLYGLGSKHMMLEKFRKQMLKDKVHLVINGFFPSIQLKQILKIITGDILERETVFNNTIAHYKYIRAEYDSGTAGKLFIILHNIDGQMLRSQNFQTTLGYIAASKNIHIIASIDHINAPIIWDQNRASAFNWVWYDVTTFEPYSEETSYENSLMVQQSGTFALSSLKHVLHSLTSNAKGIFRVLADYHLDNEDNNSYQGMSFNDLYQRCRERFYVNSDLALRAQLTEFKDHKLIKSKKGYDGVEYLSVAMDCSTLKIFLEEENG